MTIEEFAEAQRAFGRSALSSLVIACARRFLAAANLVGAEGPVIEKVRNGLHDGHVKMAPLYSVWGVICSRYRNERFDPQVGLFEDHRLESLERWGQFVHWELFPQLLRDNEFVRNILRATELLPCKAVEPVISTLHQCISDMSLPFERPLWDVTESE